MVMDCGGQEQWETVFADKKETLLSFILKCNTLVATHSWIFNKMNKYGIDKVTKTLIHLLCNGKRDGLILLDGKWGTGKTYYFNSEFKRNYDKKTIFIISTLGINSLEMFKSELFNVSYLNLSEDIKEIPNVIGSTIALSSQTPAAAAPINNVVVGIASAIKKNKLSALDGLFIIDDIERIDQKVAVDILSYCHSVYMKNNMVDFIIVSNEAEESKLKIDHKEKIISDTVPFIPTEDDTYALFGEKLSIFEIKYITFLKGIIKKHNVVNIRIISTIITGLYPLFKYHKDNPTKEINANLELVIAVYSALIILAKKYHYTLPSFKITKEKPEKDKTELSNLLDEATATGVPAIIKEYAFSIASARDVIEEIFYDKQQINIEEVVLTDKILTSGIDEKEAIQKLLEIVHAKEKKPLKVWIDAIQNYKWLTINKYIEEDKTITNDLLMSIADSYSREEVLENIYVESTRIIDTSEIMKVRESGDVKRYLSYKHSYNEKISIENRIRDDILQNGWHLFNTERLERVGSRFSPFRFIGVDIICEGIINKWETIDIIDFKNYLLHLYNFENIEDFLETELPFLKQTLNHLEDYINNNPISFRYGAIHSFTEVIRSLIKRLEEKMPHK